MPKVLPGIKNGDKRVFVINGKVRGAISRVPGIFLSNLSKGATAKLTKIKSGEMKISIKVAKI